MGKKDLSMSSEELERQRQELIAIVSSSRIIVVNRGETVTFSQPDLDEGRVELDFFPTEVEDNPGAVVVAVGEDEVVYLSCTDERDVEQVTDDQGRAVPVQEVKILRVPGAFAGLLHAFSKDQKRGFSAAKLVKMLKEVHIMPANHNDDHDHGEDDLAGCGYLGLCRLENGQNVFGVEKIELVTKVIREHLDLGLGHISLRGGHAATGLVINCFNDRVVNPTSEVAQNSFFGLDLGLLFQRLQPRFSAEAESVQLEDAMVNLVYANLAAVYVLSEAKITDYHLIESGDSEWDQKMLEIVHKGHQMFKRNAANLANMVLERSSL